MGLVNNVGMFLVFAKLIFVLFINLSFLGLGHFLGRFFLKNIEPLFYYPVGMSSVFLFFGFLLPFHLNFNLEIFYIICFFGTVWFFRFCRSDFCSTGIQKFFAGFFFVVISIRFIGLILNPIFNINDDSLVYLPHALQFQERGSLIDPLSLRRLASYGGQSIFTSFFLLEPYDIFGGLLESVIVPIAFWSLGWDLLKDRPKKNLWLLMLPVFLFSDFYRINIAPHATAAYFFALILLVLMNGPRSNRNNFYLLLLFSVVFCTLRGFFPAIIGLTWVFIFFFNFLPGVKLTSLAFSKKCILLFPIGLILFLSPFIFELFRSSGTPYYPLFPGNYSNALDTFAGVNPNRKILESVFDLLIHSNITAGFLLTGFSVFVLGFGPGVWFVLSCALICVAIVTALLAYNIPTGELARYFDPLICSFGFVFFVLLNSDFKGELTRRGVGKFVFAQKLFFLAALFLLLQGAGFIANLRETLKYVFNWAHVERDIGYRNLKHLKMADEISYIQSLVPVGEKIVVAIDEPYYLSQRRNQIYLLDIPGQVTREAKHLEFEAKSFLNVILKPLGSKYFLFQNPETSSSIYSLAAWKNWHPKAKGYALYWGPLFNTYFEFLNSLEKSHSIFSNGKFTLIKLEN